MLQFPRIRFYPGPQKCSDSSFGRWLRASLVVSLVAFIFFAPVSFAVSARDVSAPRQLFAHAAPAIHVDDHATEAQSKKEIGSVDSFIIEMVNGVSTCREATPAEVPSTLPRPGDKGISVKELLNPNASNQMAISGGENSSTGLTINLLALAQLQSDPNKATVIAAFQRAAGVWTARIKSPVTISMNIEYGVNAAGGGPFPNDDVLGATSSGNVSSDYPGARAKLITSSSSAAESGIYNSLPTSVVPTDTGNGSVIAISRSLTQPLGFLAPEPDTVVATVSLNKGFAFDFNPDDGIDFDKTDFVAVATHEIGHALGFTSNSGEGSTAQVSLWDMFRLRPGTTSATFATAQRIMSIGGSQVYFTGQAFVGGTSELGLSTGGQDPSESDGDGRQSSHWKADELTGRYIGIMDPTIPKGVIERTTENDFSALETLGWNLVDSTFPPAPPPPPSNDNFANAQVVSGCSGSVNGTNLNSSKETGEPTHVPGGGSRSVWYQWQAPSGGSVTFTTSGSGYDTTLAAYSGIAVNALQGTLLGNNDDVVPGSDLTSSVSFTANAGTIYRIAVDGFNNGGSGGDMGPIKLNWNQSNCVQPNTVQLGAAGYAVGEGANFREITVTRTDSSAAATVSYATSDTAGLSSCTVANGAASERCDYQTTVGTLRFAVGEASKSFIIPIIDDAHSEGNETFSVFLRSPTGAQLGSPMTATVTITDDATPVQNPFNDNQFFVTMQYIDFLGRLPDPQGLNGWLNTLNGCPNNGFGNDNPTCDRVHVSSGFFLSDEFRGRGYWAYRFYEVAFNRRPLYAEFVPDMAQVGGPQSPSSEVLSKAAYKDEFVQRGEFTTLYNGLTNSQFVDAIEANAEVPLDNVTLTAQLNGGKSRAQLLREIVESQAVEDQFFIRAFVAMQYFGYLRRDPDTNGYNGWVTTLTSNPSDFRHMIFGFIYSDEYRTRFGP